MSDHLPCQRCGYLNVGDICTKCYEANMIGQVQRRRLPRKKKKRIKKLYLSAAFGSRMGNYVAWHLWQVEFSPLWEFWRNPILWDS